MEPTEPFCWLLTDPGLSAESVTIGPDDARWVGAWWLGFVIAGTVTLASAVPFWFLPKSLPVPVEKHDSGCGAEHVRFIKDRPNMEHKFRPEEPPDLRRMARGTGASHSLSKNSPCKSASITIFKKWFYRSDFRSTFILSLDRIQ